MPGNNVYIIVLRYSNSRELHAANDRYGFHNVQLISCDANEDIMMTIMSLSYPPPPPQQALHTWI